MEFSKEPKWILALQLVSVAWMWCFVLGISLWILHLIHLSRRLQDVPSATIGISIVAIPIFVTGAGVLTYVFFGLRRHRNPDQQRAKEGRSSHDNGQVQR